MTWAGPHIADSMSTREPFSFFSCAICCALSFTHKVDEDWDEDWDEDGDEGWDEDMDGAGLPGVERFDRVDEALVDDLASDTLLVGDDVFNRNMLIIDVFVGLRVVVLLLELVS